MRKILILYPHWPPSNLAGVHRPRLIANFLSDFNWQPVIVTVDESYYEETPDKDLCKTVKPNIEVYRVRALGIFKIKNKRIIGDIGLRGMFSMYRKAKEIISTQTIHFIWIPVPSFYTALLGRILNYKTGIPYGIDYIDPWVSRLADYHRRITSKAWWSQFIARILEPIAVKKASLISGVSELYYLPVIKRNFKHRLVHHIGMPYGFDPQDHNIIIPNLRPPWQAYSGQKPWVYAGAFLPQSHLFLQLFFRAIKQLRELNEWDDQVHIYFLGTGKYPGKQILEYAEMEGIADCVTEINSRFPYLHVLNFLSLASRVLVIGSTEKHYTASKIFQSLLSKKPVMSIFHESSAAIPILEECSAGTYTVRFTESQSVESFLHQIKSTTKAFLHADTNWKPNLGALEKYSARESAMRLVEAIEKSISNTN